MKNKVFWIIFFLTIFSGLFLFVKKSEDVVKDIDVQEIIVSGPEEIVSDPSEDIK